tara:strand:- start:124 stop:465 length:342 start_codon:yes stop_codon:yes gene_type:complete
MSHFTRSEFKCKCGSCGQDTVDFELLDILERLRVHYGVPITINSGNRCAAYNKKIGGSKNSQHVKSRAADIVVDGVHPHRVYALLDTWYPDSYGMGRYEFFTHIDSRSVKARW